MKKPHRNFVVEFKTSRSVSKSQTRSIWGSTDLKAVAKEVETLLPPDSFSRRDLEVKVPAPVRLVPRILMPIEKPMPFDCEVGGLVLEAPQPFASEELKTGIPKEQDVGLPSDTLPEPNPAEDALRLINPSRRSPSAGRRVTRTSDIGSNSIHFPTHGEAAVVSKEDLEALHSEYKRLLLLAEKQLLSENLALKAELVRIDRDFLAFA